MTAPLRLVIFDVDGTLVDSQGSIIRAMHGAFDHVGLPVPDRAALLSIVGLSLPHAMARLAPDQGAAEWDALAEAYKRAYRDHQQTLGASNSSPLYPGAAEALALLADQPDTLLGVATGKSRRGLNAVLAAHGLDRVFVTRQSADEHPSKPHPSMILTAMNEAGADPANTVMIGDTSFDMDMAASARVAGIGVSWGYHPATSLGAAHRVIDRFQDLHGALAELWETAR